MWHCEEDKKDWFLDQWIYHPEDYTNLHQKLLSGKKLLNVSATQFVYNCLIRANQKVIEGLNHMILQGKDLKYGMVRKWVVDFYMMEFSDILLHSAFIADNNDIFYQRRDSADWQLLDANTTRYEIQNAGKYQSQLRMQLNSIVAAGAAVFQTWALERSLTSSIMQLNNFTYYRWNKQAGSLEFRYWISTSREDYDRMLSFYNVFAVSPNVKKAYVASIDNVDTKRIFFVPMIARKLTLEETTSYCDMTQEQFE